MKSKIYNLSKRYGAWMGLDLPYFTKNGSWVTLRYIFVGVFNLAISVGFARLGTKELFGEYQYVLAVLALLSVFTLPGLNLVALREVTKDNAGAVRQAVGESFKWSWLAFPLIIGYGVYLVFHGSLLLGQTFIAAGILFPFFYAPNTWYAFYEGKLRFGSVTFRVIFSTVFVGIALLSGLFAKIGLFWLIMIYFGLNGVFNWIFYGEIRNKMKKAIGSLDLKYGISCTAQKFILGLTDTLPQLVISFLFGFASVAIYQIAYLSTSFVFGFTAALSATYMPLLFKYEKIGRKKTIWANLFMGLILFLGFLVLIKIFFIMFYGKQYETSYQLAWIFSVLIIIFPLRTFLVNFFTSRGRNKLIIVSNLIANVFAVLFFYFTRGQGLVPSVAVYVYSIHLIFFALLLAHYFLTASEKMDSIRAAQSL